MMPYNKALSSPAKSFDNIYNFENTIDNKDLYSPAKSFNNIYNFKTL